VARVIGAHHDQTNDLGSFQNQADRWKASPGLTEAQAGIKAGTGASRIRPILGQYYGVPFQHSH